VTQLFADAGTGDGDALATVVVHAPSAAAGTPMAACFDVADLPSMRSLRTLTGRC
jgi:hypothetical protein